jgi:hypothetical protein
MKVSAVIWKKKNSDGLYPIRIKLYADRKNKYIATFNVNYNQGFGVISRVEYVHEYKLNGLLVYDGTGLMSRGSGLYWGIKRRFQVYPKKNKIKSS